MTHTPGFLAIVNENKTRVTEITLDEFTALKANGVDHVLIDIREDSEWTAGHAKDAIHIGKGIIERDIETRVPDPGQLLILYCGGGFRSILAADSIQKMGYSNVRSLAGGWRAWKEAGLPVES